MAARTQKGTATLQNAATATGNGTPLAVDAFDQAAFQVTGITTATITWEATVDGTNYVAVSVIDLNSATRARATTATANGLYLLDGIGGLVLVRARISAYTSGTITVVARASA